MHVFPEFNPNPVNMQQNVFNTSTRVNLMDVYDNNDNNKKATPP